MSWMSQMKTYAPRSEYCKTSNFHIVKTLCKCNLFICFYQICSNVLICNKANIVFIPTRFKYVQQPERKNIKFRPLQKSLSFHKTIKIYVNLSIHEKTTSYMCVKWRWKECLMRTFHILSNLWASQGPKINLVFRATVLKTLGRVGSVIFFY